MIGGHLHPSDENLLLYADEELLTKPRGEICAHLMHCARCSARLEEMRSNLAELSKAQREKLRSDLASAEDARAALVSRMAELSATPHKKSWFGPVGSVLTPGRQGYVFASLMFFIVLMLAVYRREIRNGSQQVSVSLSLWAEPKTNLTPGATLALTKAQVCSASSVQAPVVPFSLQHEVLALYGVSGAQSNAYEVDYLITPELGGATDIRNLWPEPYYDTAWNAHVKDQLEDRLHEMVCHGDVDLATAQRDISKDWIAAYQKYFHTETPIAGSSLHRI